MGYHNIVFDKYHKFVAVIFDIYEDESEFLMIVKNIDKNEFFPQIINNITDEVSFDQFGNIYFLRKNEFGYGKFVLKSNLVDTTEMRDPELVFEEKDPNLKLNLNMSKSGDFIFLERQSISGTKEN